MPIYLGSDKLFEIFTGTNDTAEVYVGGTKVFPEPQGTIGIVADNTNFPAGGGTINLTCNYNPVGGVQAILFQELLPGGSWVTFQNSTSNTASRAVTVNGVQFRAIGRDNYYPTNPQTITGTITANVFAAPTVSIAPTSAAGYAGTVVPYTATPTGGLAPYTYQWKSGTTNVGTNSPNYSHTISGNTSITCVVTDSLGQSATSNASAVTQWAAVGVTIAPINPSVVEGEVINFVATPTGGSGSYTYQWKLDGANIGGATAATYNRTTVLADDGKVITCTVTSSGQSATSAGSTMEVEASLPAPYIYLGPEHPVSNFSGAIWSTGAGGGVYTATHSRFTMSGNIPYCNLGNVYTPFQRKMRIDCTHSLDNNSISTVGLCFGSFGNPVVTGFTTNVANNSGSGTNFVIEGDFNVASQTMRWGSPTNGAGPNGTTQGYFTFISYDLGPMDGTTPTLISKTAGILPPPRALSLTPVTQDQVTTLGDTLPLSINVATTFSDEGVFYLEKANPGVSDWHAVDSNATGVFNPVVDQDGVRYRISTISGGVLEHSWPIGFRLASVVASEI